MAEKTTQAGSVESKGQDSSSIQQFNNFALPFRNCTEDASPLKTAHPWGMYHAETSLPFAALQVPFATAMNVDSCHVIRNLRPESLYSLMTERLLMAEHSQKEKNFLKEARDVDDSQQAFEKTRKTWLDCSRPVVVTMHTVSEDCPSNPKRVMSEIKQLMDLKPDLFETTRTIVIVYEPAEFTHVLNEHPHIWRAALRDVMFGTRRMESLAKFLSQNNEDVDLGATGSNYLFLLNDILRAYQQFIEKLRAAFQEKELNPKEYRPFCVVALQAFPKQPDTKNFAEIRNQYVHDHISLVHWLLRLQAPQDKKEVESTSQEKTK